MLGNVCVCAIAALAAGAAELPPLVPAPQEMAWSSGAEAWLDAAALESVAGLDACEGARAALERLAAKLGAPLPDSGNSRLRLVLGALPETIPARTRAEAYRLEVDVSGAVITAETAHGIHNGLVSLAELTADGRIPCVTITDWPDQAMRGTYAPGIECAEERFDQFVALKLNLLVLEDGKLFDLANPEICERFQRLAQRCRDNFIAFAPELQSLGWGHFVLQREPRAVEASWVEKAAFPVKDGRVYSPDPPLPGPVSVVNPDFAQDMEGWKAETHHGNWDDATPEEADAVSFEGGKVLRLVSASEADTVRVAQEVAVQPNARYELRCRIKSSEVSGRGAFVEVYGLRSGRNTAAFIGPNSRRVTGTADWQENSVVFETGPNQRARPGGALPGTQESNETYERVRLYLRLQEASGTAWFKDIEVRPLQSPNPLGNAVVTEAAKVIVESEDGSTRFEEGKDYTLDVPPLHYPFDNGAALGVVCTEDSRIRDGDTVLLSFNQARRGDITCCPSEPLYREFLRKAILETVKMLQPDYLHIGHDEPRFFNRCQRCTDREVSNAILFADDIVRTCAYVREADPKVRVMMWDDAVNPHQNGPMLDTSAAAGALPRDIIMNIWWYDNSLWTKQIDESLDYFLELGFDVTGSPWFRVPNAYHWAEQLDARKENPRTLGGIYTSWPEVPEPWGALEFTAEHLWSFGKPAYVP